MVDARLHDDLARLLRHQGWSGLTQAQEQALRPLAQGGHVLLMAPTGHGKTEAALLPVISRLLDERDRLTHDGKPWPPGFKALYITPLRALNRDLMQRLRSWGEALGLRIGVRHGDTSQAERARQSRSPPDLLITTPETVQLLLYGDRLRRHLRTVRFVIVDEVHALAPAERGAQLAVALERVEQVIAQPAQTAEVAAKQRDAGRFIAGSGFQRIGLSATVADPQAVSTFLAGRGRTVTIVDVEARKDLALDVVVAQTDPEDTALAAEMGAPPEVLAQVRAVRDLVRAHQRVLVFTNTRDAAELMCSRSALLDGDATPLLGLHHGSLSPEHRADVEDRFKAGDLRGLVATSSLELGIDVGAIDHVVQIQSPRSVARLVQRLGRAGHRVGAVSAGTLVAVDGEDALECMAIAAGAKDHRLEPIDIRAAPLVVLANQLVALSNEYASLDRDWAYHVFTASAPFAELDEGLFEAAWTALLELRTLFPDEQRPDRFGRSGRARRHFLDHIGLIPDAQTYRVVDEVTKRSVGTVDDAFVAASLHPGAAFVMAGRGWSVLEVEAGPRRVRVAPAKELGGAPQWSGSELPVSAMVAREVGRLRRLIARRDGEGLAVVPGSATAMEVAQAPIREQQSRGLEVPTDETVCIESAMQGLVVHAMLGHRGNETLGRITQALLHQRLGVNIGLDHDAYRIHIKAPRGVAAADLQELWATLDPDSLDLLVAMLLRDSPLLRHHLVHVAKHFGALPKTMDPNRFTQAKIDALLGHLALQEETMDRLVHDRLDLGAVASWLRDLAAGRVRVVSQAAGPMAQVGGASRRMVAPVQTDERLLAKVRERIEDSDVLMVCTSCQNNWQLLARDLPPRPRCRRCGTIDVACLRPWHKDQITYLKAGTRRDAEQEGLRKRMLRNGALVGSFGRVACLALVGRGVGPDTAARILQKTMDPEGPVFWREVLLAELAFARTNAFWG